jgi:hypothetical protein
LRDLTTTKNAALRGIFVVLIHNSDRMPIAALPNYG